MVGRCMAGELYSLSLLLPLAIICDWQCSAAKHNTDFSVTFTTNHDNHDIILVQPGLQNLLSAHDLSLSLSLFVCVLER